MGCENLSQGGALRSGFICNDYPVGEHSVLPNSVKSNGLWANNVRPYGYARAND